MTTTKWYELLKKHGYSEAFGTDENRIRNLIKPELLRETRVPDRGLFTGELPNRSRRGDDQMWDTVWSLAQRISINAKTGALYVLNTTHGQQSEVKESDLDAARLSQCDYEKLFTELERRVAGGNSTLGPVLDAFRIEWGKPRNMRAWDPERKPKKIVNGEPVLSVVAIGPKSSGRKIDETMLNKWVEATRQWYLECRPTLLSHAVVVCARI